MFITFTKPYTLNNTLYAKGDKIKVGTVLAGRLVDIECVAKRTKSTKKSKK
jgi:hypothetical protein